MSREPVQVWFSAFSKRVKLLIWLCLLHFLLQPSVLAQVIDWPTLGFSQVVTNTFTEPTCITHASDGSQRLFVLSQTGKIGIIQNGSVLPQPFLDISNRVITYGAEQGLLGLAFPPGFSTNNHFYVDYTRKPDAAIVVSRFFLSTTNANVAATNSEQVILTIQKPLSTPGITFNPTYDNHNAGQLAFGPDGYLYIGAGDGGSENDPMNKGQATNTMLGKLLRIDVESGASPYAVPPGNPFVSRNGYDPEIWALGLRNPWRFSFDDLTGDLYIADVGENKYEEVDFQPAGSSGGQNYGWRIMEGDSNFFVPFGFTNFASLTLPVAVYSHASLPTFGEAAIIGGYVYRGPSQPRMNGMYFFGDFITGWMWGLIRSGTNWQDQILYSPGFPGEVPNTNCISTFGEDDQGDLYVADYYAGKIYEIQDTLQVWTPVFSPAGGTINSNTVIVTCLTTNAEIHYTTNGVAPTLSDPIVASGGNIVVTAGFTNMACAFRSDLSPSRVASAIYALQVGTPVFTPPAGSIPSNTLVSLSTVTPGAAIYYTTNGTIPTTNSALYLGPLILSGGTTVEAIGVASGYNNSSVVTASYSASQTATPVFTPTSGPITNATSISMSCTTPNAIIYYTLDGSMPTISSAIYSSPVMINGGTTLNAFAMATNYVNSSIRSTFYQLIQTATPVFNPSSGPITNGTPIAITCATPASTIYYTLDGSIPTTGSSVYAGPVPIEGGTTLSAFATANQFSNSLVQSTMYQWALTATPMFNPSSGPLTNGVSIEITCATPGSVIYYTTDGTTPTTNSSVYSGYLTMNESNGGMTLNALATANGWANSPVQGTYYGLLSPVGTVVTTFAGGPTAGFTNGFLAFAKFSNPQGICLDQYGNFYVADTGNNVIRKISPAGNVTTVAGSGVAGSELGTGTNAQFSAPSSVIADNVGNVYVADGNNENNVYKIDTNETVTFYANIRTNCNCLPSLWQLAIDTAGNVYVGSWATVQEIATNRTVMELGGPGCGCDGWGGNVGPCVYSVTNVFAATSTGFWGVYPDGDTELLVGGTNLFSDGASQQAGFYGLQDVIVDASTNFYLTDTIYIRKINSAGWVNTMAGTGVAGYKNGIGSVAQFNDADQLCMDTNGNIYVADAGNNCIREISPDTAGIGIPDWWQLKYFGYVGINPDEDPDNTGMTAYEDFWAGLNPTNPASVFKVVNATVANGTLQINWTSVLGKNYTVQSSTNLINWNSLGTLIPGNGSVLSFTNSIPSTNDQQFYRIVVDF